MNLKRSTYILITIIFFINSSYSNELKIITDNENYFSITIPNNWNKNRLDKGQLLKYSYKNKLQFELFQNIDSSSVRPNIVHFSENFIKTRKNIGFLYKTIKKGKNKFVRFYYSKEKNRKYIVYYKKKWNRIYTLFFTYIDSNDEKSINKIINSFDVSIPFNTIIKTQLFKSYLFSGIGLVVFIFFGYGVAKSFSSIQHLRKLRKKNIKEINLSLWKKSIKKYKISLLTNSGLLLLSILILYTLTPISINILGSTILSAIFGLADTPDIIEGFENAVNKIEVGTEAMDIDDFFDIDIDF